MINKQVDIIHLHVCDGGPFFRKSIILYTGKVFHVKTILHHHTDYELFFNNAGRIKRWYIKRTLRSADVNIVLGECHKDQIIKFSKTEKIVVIRNGIDIPEKNRYNNNGFGIMFLGWFKDLKGFFDFLDAFVQIRNKIDKRFKLILCGGGTDKEIERIKDYKLEECIYYIGWADKAKKEELFSKVIINILPSYKEGLPMSVIETMSMGIPNIASDVTTIPEIIRDGINGYVIKAGNTQDLAEKLYTLIYDKDMRGRMSAAAYETIKEHFDVDKQMKQTEAIYRQLMKQR